MNFSWQIVFFLCFIGCNDQKSYEKENKETIFEQRLLEIKKNGIELYPQIRPCKDLDTLTDSRICFQKQLNLALKENLEQSLKWNDSIQFSQETDTLWLNIKVSREGNILLENDKDDFTEYIKTSIENTFKELSPIKAATINGSPVNCSFKLPLIIKKKA